MLYRNVLMNCRFLKLGWNSHLSAYYKWVVHKGNEFSRITRKSGKSVGGISILYKAALYSEYVRDKGDIYPFWRQWLYHNISKVIVIFYIIYVSHPPQKNSFRNSLCCDEGSKLSPYSLLFNNYHIDIGKTVIPW